VKKKISVAALIMSGCGMMIFAATTADPCTEKQKSCANSCGITQSQSLRRGVDRLDAENAYKQCVQACDKAKAECEGKAKKP
jgi:hypothetical protein